MARVLRDPLLHFLLLGAALYAGFRSVTRSDEAAPPDGIVVTAAQVDQLVEAFRKTWRREPTAEERDNLIEDHVRQEVFYREALAAGLDRDDGIVRRRMQQKLEFLMDDIAGQVAPTEQELQAFLEEHADEFREPPVVSFRHVFLKSDRGDAAAVLARLRAGEEVEGDPLRLVEPAFENEPQSRIARVFGDPFATSIVAAPVGEWSGPHASGYGRHLVLVESLVPGRLPPLADARDRVVSEWRLARAREMRDDVYRELRAKYRITVEGE